MKIKGLVLGAAAGAIAVTGAQAADLPVVEPVDYVRICDAYGAGYYFIPGTETCLRVAGRIRADYNVYFNLDDGPVQPLGNATATGSLLLGPSNGLGYNGNGQNGYRFRARAYIYMDSRTNTEFGLLRTFTEVHFTRNFNAGPGTTLNRAFIQFGGLTFGRTQSFIDGPFQGTTATFDGAFSDNTTNVLAYTAAFGNGFYASVSLEDNTEATSGIIGPGLANVEQGARLPDLVGVIGVDQGWGSASLSGALRYLEEVTTNDTDIGFAIRGSVSVNVPFGNGTQFLLTGAYGQGASDYVASGFNSGSFGYALLPGSGTTFGADAIVVGGNIQTSDAFSVSGGLSTDFTPTIGFDGRVGYAYIDHNALGDGSFIDAEGFLGWNPVSGFVIGAGLQFRYEDINVTGLPGQDGSAITGLLRAQRTF